MGLGHFWYLLVGVLISETPDLFTEEVHQLVPDLDPEDDLIRELFCKGD